MPSYINTQTQEYPISFDKLKKLNPNVSFSKAPSSFGDYVAVENASLPSYDSSTQFVTEIAPVESGGVYTRTWSISDYTSEQIAQKQATADESASKENRYKRNKLLSDTDWTQMNDSPLSNEDKTAWATYRQELRDVSDLDAWPHLADEDWPVEP